MVSPPDPHEEPFRGPGEIRALLRSVDWSSTPLGPVWSWPRSLIGFVRLILEMPTPAIVFWGHDHTQIYNDGYAAIMGALHPRYFGGLCAACWPATYPALESLMRKVLAGGTEEFVETHFPVTRDGFVEEAYFTLSFSPIHDDAGEIAGIFQPIVEVTESVLARRRAETLHALVQVPEAADVIAILSSGARDVPFSAISLWDDAAGRLEVVAASDGLAEHDCAALHKAALDAINTGACVRIDDFGFAPVGPFGDPTPSAFVVPLRQSGRGAVIFGISPRLRFDESYREFLESVAATFDSAGERALLVAREATARREVEHQKERLDSLFMQAPMPVCVLRGPDHVIELVNPMMCDVWRRPYAEVIERPLFEAVRHIGGQVFRGLLDEVLRTGQAFVGKELVAQFQGPNDSPPREVTFNFVYEPLRCIGGDVTGVIVIAFDVTDEVRARGHMAEVRDAAERENRRKDEFIALLGHELRNPLAAMVTSVALIRKRLPAGSPIAHNVDVIERQANTLRRMVNDLLEVARITEGKIELRKQRIDLAEVVDGALESSREQLKGRNHDVSVSRPLRPAYVLADPVRIEQVTVNLLTNAAKYTNPGGRISVTVEEVGERVELRVKDNGIGIAEDLQPRLFEVFEQGGRDSARAEGGLGLGLTIVRRLVELHGGTVEARSGGAGQGSEFVVSLPRETRVEVTGTAPEAGHQPAPAGRGRTVLVVDDNQDAAASLAEVLEMMGHEPRTAFDAPSALTVLADWNPDVVFLDIGLPGMDGYELAGKITRRSGRRPTLVALTGYGQASDRARARDAGFDHHLVKPADLSEIEGVLEKLKDD